MKKSKESVSVVVLDLILDDHAKAALDGQSRICNWLYNELLERSIALKKEYIDVQDSKMALTLYSKRGLRNLLPDLKKENSFLKSVHSSPLKNAALRLSNTIQDYQKSRKGKRKGGETGWPRFRSWQNKWFSLLYDEPNKGFKVKDNELKLSLGVDEEGKRLSVVTKLKDTFVLRNKEIRNLRIVKKNGRYQAIFTVIRKVPKQKEINSVISLDPNHKNIVYGVDLEGQAVEVEAPRWLKNYDKRIDELKSKRDRCKKKSKSIKVDYKEGVIWLPSRRGCRLIKHKFNFYYVCQIQGTNLQATPLRVGENL